MTFTDYTGYDPEMSYGVLDTGIDRVIILVQELFQLD